MQVEFLRDLNKRGDAEAVIQQFEGGRIVSTEATLGEYVRALASVDKLNGSSLLRTLQVWSRAAFYRAYPVHARKSQT